MLTAKKKKSSIVYKCHQRGNVRSQLIFRLLSSTFRFNCLPNEEDTNNFPKIPYRSTIELEKKIA